MKHALIFLLTCVGSFLFTPSLQATSTPVSDHDDQLLSVIISLKTDVTCYGGNNGLAVVAAVGGLPPYVFVWANGTLGPINANLSAGVHTVTCTDLLGATATFDVVINEPPQLLVNVAAQVDVDCLHASGSATVATSGGTGTSLVVWSNGQIGLSATNLSAGVYLATATDANGCVSVKTVNIEADVQLPSIDIDLSADLQVDCGSPLVSLDASASAAGSGILYLWTTVNGHIAAGANSNIASVDAAGTYKLLITNNGNGCTNTQTVNVSADLTLPVVDIQAALNLDLQLDCLTPELTLNGTGSASGAGIVYLWTTVDGHIVAGANTLNGVIVDAAGTYVLHVTNNNNGCSNTENITLSADLDLPLVSINTGLDLQLDCISPVISLDASASASGSGISYLWTTLNGHIAAGVNSNIATVDAAGNYVLHISDSNNGCSASASVNVSVDLQLPTINIAVAAPLGCANSSIVLNASASSQGNNFLYLWTTLDGNIVAGGNSLTPTVNAAGTYTLSITNILNGCSVSASVLVIGVPALNISLNGVINVSCFGLLNGAATLSVNGGTGPYTYLWSNGMVSASVSGLAAGIYFATVTDAQGCQGVVNVTIGQPAQITATVSTTPASGPGNNDGTASLSVTGGTAPYTYLWSNGMTTASVSGLAAGTYTVTVTDAAACTITVVVIIADMSGCALGINVTSQNADCNQSNGQATAQAQGASGNVSYLWSNGMTTATITNLPAGTYVVTITDGQGCSSVGAAIIASIDHVPPVVITKNVTLTLDANCNASLTTGMVNNGSSDNCSAITLSLNINLFDGTQIGNQIVILTATDQSGNTASASAIITIVDDTPPTLQCPANVTLNTGSGVVDYNLPVLQDNCSAPNATMVLTGGLPSGSLFPQGTTTVTYTAFGIGGFITTCNFTVTVGGGLLIDFDMTLPTCPGSSDGSITANVSGGTGNYNYLWINANNQTTATATGLSAGVYTVVIVDDAGNVILQTLTLPDPPGISISMVLVVDNCDGSGSLDVTVTGGTPPYTYAWYDGNGNLIATTEDLDNVPSGNYTLVVTDANGCTYSSGIITVNLTTGIVENELDSFGIIGLSPNPTADGQIVLDVNFPEASPVRIEVFNINGQQMGKVIEENNIQKGQYPLNLGAYMPGQYTVKISTPQHLYVKKVIFIH